MLNVLPYSPCFLGTPPYPFHLKYTLTCGQIFGWSKFFGGYLGFIENSPVFLQEEGTKLKAIGNEVSMQKLSCFFRWDDPLFDMIQPWEKGPPLSQALKAFPGLRIIRQDPWNCLVGFILSICSNIPKIERTLKLLGQKAGEAVPFLNTCLYAIPSAETIARVSVRSLCDLGMGFRARYLRETAWEITRGFPLKSLEKLPYLEAKMGLMSLPGIGEKVADCILLFGLGHLEAFPVDVWMKRTLQEHYFRGKGKTYRYLSEWGRDRFGPFAGYAQQYLYAYSRKDKESDA